MNFSLVSSSSEITCPCSKSSRHINEKLLVSKPFVRVGYFKKKDHRVLNHDSRKVAVSRSLIPESLQEPYIGEKHLKEEASLKFKFVRTLLIDNYDSYTYNIYQELSIINGESTSQDRSFLCKCDMDLDALIAGNKAEPGHTNEPGVAWVGSSDGRPPLGATLPDQVGADKLSLSQALYDGATTPALEAHWPLCLQPMNMALSPGVPPVVVRNDEWTWEDIRHYLYEKKAFDNIVISPGPGSPTCPADIGICLRLLLECRDIPILGVCLGHQALGYVHGARIVHAPEPVHGRLSEIEHTGCNLFHDIPSGRNSGFKVVRYHSLVIDADSLPEDLIPIAWTSSTDTLSFRETQHSNVIPDAFWSQSDRKIPVEYFATDIKNTSSWSSNNSEGMKSTKVIMGIMHSTRPHYGVQFHPESIATYHGRKIFENFRKMTKNYWLRSSSIDDRKVPRTSRLFSALPKSKLLMNNEDKRNQLSLCNTVMLSHKSIGARFLKLKWRKFECLANKVGGARNIFCELFGDQKAENTFWLDSSSVEQRRARFSYMGGKGGSLWKQVTFRLSDQSNAKGGGYLSTEDAQGSVQSAFLEDGFLEFLNKELQSFRYKKEDYEGLPFDFCGGYIGFMGYNLKVECGMASNRHKSRTPDACLFFADNLVVIDHHYDDIYIMSLDDIHHHPGTAGPHERSTTISWLDDTEQKLLHLKASTTKKFKEHMSWPVASTPCKEGFLTEKSRDQYMEDVEKCLKFIKDGESYELCLTTQMRKRIGDIDYLGLYLNLRERNPSPYAAWLNFSKENLCICCSSPERFLRLDRDDILEAKPIKGTIARGSTPEEDKQLKLQLQHSEKDQAENLMIVDLLRNDLGRVSEPGSVHVPCLMEVESYATVHTLVSTVRGKKQLNLSPVDCVRAAFPGGSMTGAPKLRSMEILDSLESCSRGIYSGSIGFFSYNQTFDLNIVIRTVVIHEGEASIGAGGAVVALSNPEDEYEEMILKTQAPVKTVMGYQSGSDLS
ncbi:hypothetical protein HHK36_026122 [Tetracentron sinense]|uniref:aminodeoxychorismate synthase n=1 Tax=Tetracentron sinense TaxID=13715 RepID=A0A834YJD1_TETSI|nr:hypothetical protein HHK36_026122 [Tetracentron sinense]